MAGAVIRSICKSHREKAIASGVVVRVDRLLGEMRIARDSDAGRREFERQMERRRAEAEDREWKAVRRGWCLGDSDTMLLSGCRDRVR
jgi:hypothetical protein